MKSPTNPKRTLIESLQVGLARDSQIKEWAERELPNGEVVGRVKNAQTVNYKTLKPVKDGLFCEKIFGPIKDFECACGFKQTRGGFCPQCNVEFTRSEVRRYRLGYFQLPSAVAHVWYLRGRPSYISYLLGIKIKKALALTYGAASLLVNSNNEKGIFQKGNETLPFSFTTQTLYSVGECKGKAIPRSGTRRYNPNYFLFDRERAKLIQNLFQNFLYSYRSKRNQNSHLLPKFILAQKANLEDFSNEKKENLRNSLLGAKIDFSKKEQGFISHADTTPVSSASHRGATHPNSYLTRGFFFSSTIRSGWHPLIVVNLQDKLPVKFLYKKENPRYYKFKKHLKFSKNIGFCTPPIFNVDNDDDVFAVNLFNEAKKKKQRKNENLSGVKINHPNEKFNTINSHFGDFVSQNGISSNGCSTVYKVKCEDNKKGTKSFLKKLVFKKTKNQIKKSLIGVDKNKEVGVATLLFYPIKKEINKLQEKKYLLKNSSELTRKIYQELASKFTSLNSVENTINQVDFSAISEKERDLQSEYFENNQSAKPMDEFSRKSVEEIDGSTVKGSEKSQSFALKKKELEDFRSIFHFIGQPCQLRKKSRFLIHTACNFSQTRNEIFKILKKAKSINSVQFGDQLPCYDENLKEKYRILNNNIKKKYQQNHLFPFLFCLSCQSRNYQYLQTYSNFFLPTPPDSEKTLLISSYKHQIRKEQSLNLYDSFIRDNFVISTLFSCFNNCSTVDLRNLVNTLSMSPSVDFLVEKKEIKNLENLVEQNQFPVQGTEVQRTQNVNNNQSFEKEGNNGISPLSMESTIFENGLQSKFTSKNDLQLQNTNNIQNLTTTLSTEDNGQVNHILGEIPLVLTSCRNIAWRSLSLGGGTTKMAAQPLDATTKFLQSKSLNSRPKSLKRRREKNLKFFQQENQTVSFLELKQNSPLLQDKDLNLFVRKNVESQLNQNQFDVFDVDLFSFSKNKEMKKKPLSSASHRGATHSNILQNKNLVLSKSGKQYSRFQKVDLFERFGRQNFYFGWKTRKQIKKILKIDKILGNLKKSIRPPIPSASWSYLFKKSNKEDYLFSIYEISVQQALGYTCGEAILKLLSPIDCDQLESGLKVVLWQINERISEVENQGFLLKSDIILLNSLRTKKSRTLRRLKIAKILRKTKVLPKQMVFSLLPVLPPSLRPIIQLDENIVAVSDCSQIYQKIVQRSNRLSKRMSKYLSYDHCLRLKVLLQQAVDGLIENGKGGSKPLCDNNGRPLKSLSDGLKGKKGRFRQDLLGRRVDYSGRSVIVVGPALKLHQCGLPKEMAIELFQPFLIRQLFAKKIVSNIAVAKNYIKKETPIVLEILKQLLKSHPVLLNRAPTLHRLGVQAFQPKLVSGRAILLHPLVCSAFNADFDGDQMAVHIPLSSKARGEAWKILWSRNNILSPATGQPILVPSQDMVLGCYYLTTKKANLLIKRANVLQNKMLSTKREDGTSWSQNVKSSTVNILQGKIFYSNKPFLFGPDVLGSSLPQSGKVESTQNKERNSESQFPQSQSDKETEPTTTFPKDKYKNQLSTGKTLSESIVLHSYITHKNGEDVDGFNGSQKTVISNDPHNRDFEDQNFVKQNLVEQNRTGKDRNGLKNLSPEKKKGPNNLVKQDIFYFDKEQPHTKIWFSPGETITKKYNLTTGSFFNSSDQVLKGLQQKRLKLHTSIWLKMEHDIEIQKEEQKPLEARINCCGNFTKIYPGYLRRFYKKEGLFFNNTNIKKPEDFYVRTTCGRVMLNQTISPISHQPF